MANQIKMAVRDSILTLYDKGWSQRRIAKTLEINRETVARHIQVARGGPPNPAIPPIGIEGCSDSDPAIPPAGAEPAERSKPAIVPTGKPGRRSDCEPYLTVILAGIESGLTAQRLFQDLRVDHGFAGGYDSVKRCVRRLTVGQAERVHRMECSPGEEAQVDFGLGAPVLVDGHKRRTWVFRIVLSHSRKAYSEAVRHQTTEEYIRCLENAFRHFGGVPRMLVIDNLRAAVQQADWYEPELTPKVAQFCRHYGTVTVPTRPYTPEHKGKVERGVAYIKSNALKGRVFASLAEENQYLLWWEQNVADQRIHGTTRQHVGRCFEERERSALSPLAPMLFPCFQEGRRAVHRDSFVEVQKAYYEVPEEYIGREVWVRWDARLVRISTLSFEDILTHARVPAGQFQRRPGGHNYTVEHTAVFYQKKALKIGPKTGDWAARMLAERGPLGVGVLRGLLALTRDHRPSRIEAVCAQALSIGLFRLRDLRRLLEQPEQQEQFTFMEQHPLIRDMAEYGAILEALYPDNPWRQEEVVNS
jgi:transposase